MNKLVTALVAVALAAPLAAEEPRRGGTLTYSVTGDADTFDCHASPSVAVQHRMAPHYSLLIKIDPGNYPEIGPDLAERWSASPDQTLFTFNLRPGITFHDGSPLTSADVKASFDRIRNPPAGVVSLRRGLFAEVTAIETPDPLTVTFRIQRPDPAFLLKVASPWNCIYSARLMASDPDYPARKVMGTGPFRFAERVAGSHWIGTRFDGYFLAGKPYLDRLEILDLAGPALLNALAAGRSMGDFRGIAPVQRDRLVATRGDKIKVVEMPQTANLLITFKATRKPFDDPRVRRALSLAIDRWGAADPIGRQSLFAYVGGLLRPGYSMARTPEELAQLPGFGRDMEAARAEARRLLAEAGVPNLTFTFTNRPAYTPVGIYLVDQWRRIGVTAKHDQLENQPFFGALAGASFDAIVDSLNEYTDDPTLTFQRFQSFDRASANQSRAIDRQLDALYDRIITGTDPAQRRADAQAFEARFLTEAYSVPFLWSRRMIPLGAEVEGWQLTPSYYLAQDMAEVWLKP